MSLSLSNLQTVAVVVVDNLSMTVGGPVVVVGAARMGGDAGIWARALVSLDDVAAVLHVPWCSASEGGYGGGDYSPGLGLVLLEWAGMQGFRHGRSSPSMTWRLSCTFLVVQQARWGGLGRYSPGLSACRQR
jgi:hypothetical protein